MCLTNKITTTVAIASIFYSTFIIAQDKLLTIQDAVLKGRTTLAPKRLQALGFIKASNKFSFIDNNTIKVGDNAIGKTTDVLTLKELNAILKMFEMYFRRPYTRAIKSKRYKKS